MQNRILICRSNPIDPDPRVAKIARALVRGGYSVQALGWDRFGKSAQQDDEQGFAVTRLPLIAGFGRGMGNLGPLLRWQFTLVRWLVAHRHEYDAIHACDFDTILPALLCQRLFRKKVVYDIFDFYAEHLRATPAWIKNLIRRTDLWAIGHADAVIIVDDSRRAQIAGSYPRLLEVVYNSPEDQETLNPPVQAASANDTPLRIAYVGLLQVERGLMEMLDVVAAHPSWHLDLAGFGGDESQILARARQLPNVRAHGRIDYDTALSLSRSADVLFATYDPAISNHKYSSPNKVFEAMMLGKPVVVAAQSGIDQVIAAENCGLVVPYGDRPALDAALTSLARDPDLRARLGKQGRRAYERIYGWPRMAERLLALYRQVCSTGKSS